MLDDRLCLCRREWLVNQSKDATQRVVHCAISRDHPLECRSRAHDGCKLGELVEE